MAIMEDRGRFPPVWLALAVLQTVSVLALGAAFSLYWAPEPHSDWLLYWRSAGDPGAYERGGVGLWLLALPKGLGVAPHVAALALNLPAAAWLCALAYRVDRTRFRLFAQLAVAYLLLITPYFGIVQLDLVGAALLVTGLWLLLDTTLANHRPTWRTAVGLVAIAAAVSTRPQYALVLWTLLILVILARFLGTNWKERRLGLAWAGLLLASVVGFGVDMGLRQASGKTEEVRTSSAVTLYAGLLVSADTRAERCGQWTPEAAEAASEDLHLPLVEAIGKRIASRPPKHWVNVLGCKAPQVIAPPAYALYWLMESPNVVARRAALDDGGRLEARYAVARKWERRVARVLGWAILAAGVWTALRGGRSRRLIAMWPLAWIGAFWLVHAVFETQGRYYLSLYVIAPLLCAMVWLPRSGMVNGPTRQDQPAAAVPH